MPIQTPVEFGVDLEPNIEKSFPNRLALAPAQDIIDEVSQEPPCEPDDFPALVNVFVRVQRASKPFVNPVQVLDRGGELAVVLARGSLLQ